MSIKRTVIKAASATEYLYKKSIPQSNGCVYFTSPLNVGGYGKIGSTQWAKNYKINSAHQLSYILAYGDYDRKYIICHKCNNRRCVNPDHLYLGTVQDNSNDMVRSGRSLIGSKNLQSKLTEGNVRFILDNEDQITQADLGRLFGVTRGTIWKILRKYSWNHVAN